VDCKLLIRIYKNSCFEKLCVFMWMVYMCWWNRIELKENKVEQKKFITKM